MRFPAPLPPDTVLDCILDDDAAETGVLYVLDVIRWRGTDVAECEADFRYASSILTCSFSEWELKMFNRFWFRDARLGELIPQPEPTRAVNGSRPYPHRFVGVPYYLPPLTPALFLESIIPRAQQTETTGRTGEMEMDTGEGQVSGGKSDGILLYVREAAYTSGETPLSCWVPATPLENAMEQESPLRLFQRCVFSKYSVASGSNLRHITA